ncbi:Tfp pilus assembly protein PilF [Marivirga sericea]|uniref:Tfp pilus assembly protein PilF n=1 Tax=Marivirga sericea TaxID=1028 RepID=A0A1X7I6Y3_9BACT|nr:tetratricopeptide repeat protein [Marivirga sericea]SMG10309.1 Tfp pilus assembly protein PilF [Marivirga sericea]
MTIYHKIDNFIFSLFNIKSEDEGKLIDAAKQFYSFQGMEPTVSISEGLLKIELNEKGSNQANQEFQEVLDLCNSRQFEEAKPLIESIIKESPQVSEFHRVYGQILSELGDQEEAQNELIDALKWDPNNEWALLMMGNILVKEKNDIDAALKYYDQILETNPEENITLNNIGAVLMNQGRFLEAQKYFQKSIEIQPEFPNPYYALGRCHSALKQHSKAFELAITAAKKNNQRDEIYTSSLQLALDSATAIREDRDEFETVESYKLELQERSGVEITIEPDPTIQTAAKLEINEKYKRGYHLVKFNPKHSNVEHLIMHELVHLEFILDARDNGENFLFTSSNHHKSNFEKPLQKYKVKLIKNGIEPNKADKLINSLFDGINGQIYNTPIDIFIEDLLYKKHENLRPTQFLSIFNIVKDGIKATTSKDIVNLTPAKVVSVSKILNLVNALHFKDLFGVDLIQQFKATPLEKKQGEEFFEEFSEYRQDKQPGEEYEIIQHWAEDLEIDTYFELKDEMEVYKSQSAKVNSPEDVLESIEKDPYGLDQENPDNEAEMKTFIETHSKGDVNMAVAMYMVEALKYFSNMPQEDIKKIAFEIAHIGITGINPSSNYKVGSIPGKSFSGYHLLAYYYTSWALAVPEMLSQLQMPFDEEFRLANLLNEN